VHAPSEKKICQNCKSEFAIGPDDFGFYAKMNVPPPTWCVNCRLQRRLAFRNERHLYKRQCNAPGHTEALISMYASESDAVVYDHDYWWSDQWSPTTYAANVDLSRPFLEQFRELLRAVPRDALVNFNAVRSDYCNYTTDNKDCYLVFGGDFNENCLYSTFNFHSKDSADLYWADKCELCYEMTDSGSCYNVSFSEFVKDCTNSAFLADCSGCSNCVGCVNLKNKSYCILNEQLSREEYEKRLRELHLEDRESRAVFAEKFRQLKLLFPHRYARIVKSVNCSGDNVVNAKNCANCFDVTGPAEDCKDVYLAASGLRDVRGTDHVGHQAELVHDSFAIFSGVRSVVCSMLISNSYNVAYSYNCRNTNNIFGCVGLQNKQYCILNRQYSKEEYEALMPVLIKYMNDVPYTDALGRTYHYGEFFPSEFSPFAYNETIAHEIFPLSRNEAELKGFRWRDEAGKHYAPTLASDKISSTIAGTDDNVLQATVECEHRGACEQNCTTAFRVTPAELALYRRLNLPVPRLCPSCRHYERLKLRNPMRAYDRQCECGGVGSVRGEFKNFGTHSHGINRCTAQMKTTYAPDRPEIVYCEDCYQAEIV
jgi:hypothetical protein